MSTFTIDGDPEVYDLVEDFTMGDAMILQKYTGRPMGEVELDTADAGVIATLVHLGIKKKFPAMSDKQIEARVKETRIDAVHFVMDEGDDADPPVPVRPVRPPKDGSGGSSAEDTGGYPEQSLAATGT